MIPALYGTAVSAASFVAAAPLAGDEQDKALSVVMIVLTVIQIILGLGPA